MLNVLNHSDQCNVNISDENSLVAPDSANAGMGSNANFKDPTKLEYVLDWPNVVKKYYSVIKNVPTE